MPSQLMTILEVADKDQPTEEMIEIAPKEYTKGTPSEENSQSSMQETQSGTTKENSGDSPSEEETSNKNPKADRFEDDVSSDEEVEGDECNTGTVWLSCIERQARVRCTECDAYLDALALNSRRIKGKKQRECPKRYQCSVPEEFAVKANEEEEEAIIDDSSNTVVSPSSQEESPKIHPRRRTITTSYEVPGSNEFKKKTKAMRLDMDEEPNKKKIKQKAKQTDALRSLYHNDTKSIGLEAALAMAEAALQNKQRQQHETAPSVQTFTPPQISTQMQTPVPAQIPIQTQITEHLQEPFELRQEPPQVQHPKKTQAPKIMLPRTANTSAARTKPRRNTVNRNKTPVAYGDQYATPYEYCLNENHTLRRMLLESQKEVIDLKLAVEQLRFQLSQKGVRRVTPQMMMPPQPSPPGHTYQNISQDAWSQQVDNMLQNEDDFDQDYYSSMFPSESLEISPQKIVHSVAPIPCIPPPP